MSLRTLWREIKRSMTFWEKVDRIPNWAWKKLDPMTLQGFEYRIVKGKHYIYKTSCEDNGGEQGHNWDINLYRKKIIR